MRNPPSVALIVGSLARGGMERQISEFVRTAHPSHADCVVICLSSREGEFAAEVRAAGATVVTMGFVGAAKAWQSARAVLRLFRFLHREQPDVVYAFMFWGYVLGLLTAKVAAPRALRVAGLRSAPDLDKPSKTVEPLRRLALNAAHGAITNATPAYWEEAYPSLAAKLVRIPNGVAIPSVRHRQGESGRIVCVANLKPVKGHATLLQALASLPPGLEWKLQLCGEGPERDSLQRQAEHLGLDGSVEFLGSVRDISSILDEAEIAVLPSYSENLPNAVLEAMAHGVPVVATRVGDIPELLQAGTGTLVSPGDAGALGAAIRRYLKDSHLRERTGAAGRREVEQRYSVEAMRDRTLAAFLSFEERRS